MQEPEGLQGLGKGARPLPGHLPAMGGDPLQPRGLDGVLHGPDGAVGGLGVAGGEVPGGMAGDEHGLPLRPPRVIGRRGGEQVLDALGLAQSAAQDTSVVATTWPRRRQCQVGVGRETRHAVPALGLIGPRAILPL